MIDHLFKIEEEHNGNVQVFYLDTYGNIQDIDNVQVKYIPFLGDVIILKQEEVDL